MSRIAGEFALIERYFAPLSAGAPGAFGLRNDAAVLDIATGSRLVTTVDCMVAGRHFLTSDPPDGVARKLLRVNLSDLAAMGARPTGYLLAASWPLDLEEGWIAGFCEGLAGDQRLYGISLIGGDTTATAGPMTLSLTAFGEVRGDHVLDRASLKPGDDLYMSGTLGDGYLGLRALQGELEGLTEEQRDALVERYRCPQPRLSLGQALLQEGLAASALDVSDGLAQDLGHLLTASGVGAVVRFADLPISGAARAALRILGESVEVLLSGGDDYELLFAAAPNRRAELARLSDRLSLPITPIGVVQAGDGLSLVDSEERPVRLKSPGWTHF